MYKLLGIMWTGKKIEHIFCAICLVDHKFGGKWIKSRNGELWYMDKMLIFINPLN